MEACRIAIQIVAPGQYDVGAPMQHKPLCYEILKDARRVIERTADAHFSPLQDVLVIVMDMSGRVDVAAPLPPRELCGLMLEGARDVIERYNDETAPAQRPFSARLVGASHADSLSATAQG